ncbi:MAG: NAD kinase [Bacteroidia bacterium]|nr:MAG: NAD kinase [Bacteroidia bacterium]
MKIAFFGRAFDPSFFDNFRLLVHLLEEKATSFQIYESLYNHIRSYVQFKCPVTVLADQSRTEPDTFCLISLGGDGTLLDTITLVQDTGIPVLGINTGRLGFLSAISSEEISFATNSLLTGDYTIDKRATLQLVEPDNLFGSINYALNELTVLKRDNATMITISVYVDDLFLNTYWADGLIVATPTGSTGYSLSCGGPIISPESRNLVITPIATHNLTVRPIVIPDHSLVKLKITGRTQDYLVLLDSRSRPLNKTTELVVTRAGFPMNLICVGQKDFYKTIRNKLAWGLDKRN